MVGIGACVSIQFFTLEYCKRAIVKWNTEKAHRDPGQFTPMQLFFAGAISGTANSILSGPIEHVRTRLQIQTSSSSLPIKSVQVPSLNTQVTQQILDKVAPHPSTTPSSSAAAPPGVLYKGPFDFTKKVISEHGIQGLYKGQTITLIREFIGFGIYFLTYEWLIQRELNQSNNHNHNNSFSKNNNKNEFIPKLRSQIETWKLCCFGATSGLTLWTCIYPIDVIKSKLQTDGFTKATQKYHGILDCMKKIWKSEGIGGFYRGFGPCIVRAAPVNAVIFFFPFFV